MINHLYFKLDLSQSHSLREVLLLLARGIPVDHLPPLCEIAMHGAIFDLAPVFLLLFFFFGTCFYNQPAVFFDL